MTRGSGLRPAATGPGALFTFGAARAGSAPPPGLRFTFIGNMAFQVTDTSPTW
jgi:hypothetical protein